MKILDSNNNNFDNLLNKLLLQRKKKIQSSFISVTSIVKDVKKKGDKALLKYEKRFNKNKTIIEIKIVKIVNGKAFKINNFSPF